MKNLRTPPRNVIRTQHFASSEMFTANDANDGW
jgi:hypothetical protein